MFREKEYLESKDMEDKSLSGKDLHPDLKDLLEIGKKTRKENLQKVVNQRSFLALSTTCRIVFVSSEEELKWQHRSLKQIQIV